MFDAGLAYIRDHPKLAVAGGIGVLGLAYVIHQSRKAADQNADTGMATNVSPYGPSSDVGNVLGGSQPGTIAGVAYLPGPTVTRTVPQPIDKPGIISVIVRRMSGPKKGELYRAQFSQLIDKTRSCPQGYVLVVATDGKPECITLDQRVTKERYAPVIKTNPNASKTTKQAGDGDWASETARYGANQYAYGGEGDPYTPPSTPGPMVPLGFVSPWTAQHAMQLYSRVHPDSWGYGTAKGYNA